MTESIEHYVLYAVIGNIRRYNQFLYVERDDPNGLITGEKYGEKDEYLGYIALEGNYKKVSEEEFKEYLRIGHFKKREPAVWNNERLVDFLSTCNDEGHFRGMNMDGVIAPGRITLIEYIQTQDEDGLAFPKEETAKKKKLSFADYVSLGRPIKLRATYQKVE